MQFGVCTTVENSSAVKAAGWDFVEERVDLLIQGLVPDWEWTGAARAAKSVLPILAANVLVPPVLKITGPEADIEKLREYMTTVFSRSSRLGIKTLVFGSGGARNVPEGFPRDRARQQILDFLRLIAPMAQLHGMTIVIEHLNLRECNIINSINEAMTYVMDINHPSIRCLADTYHFWLNDEMLESLRAAMPWITHVHVSDKDRTAPGTSGQDDYKPIFSILKKSGYDGPISVEAVNFDVAATGAQVLGFLKDQWNAC